MITSNDIATLLDPQLRDYIAGHLSDDPGRVALSLREHGALIATQIKYLQRARVKLPSYYAALCILPPLSFEQSSSEETASVKRYSGDTCLDLTCGLGVDAFYLSKRFRQVIAVERNAELSEIARINFRLLGVQNIRVVNSPAEAFLEQLRGQTQTTPDRNSGTIDLIYIDPARRDDQGKKVWLLEDCSPDAKALMPQLLALAPKVVVKASPLFDVRSFQVVRRYGFGRDRIGSRRVQRSTDRSFTASAATTRTARKTTTVAGGRASTSTGIAAGRSNGKPKRRPNPANHRRQAFALLRPHLGHMDRPGNIRCRIRNINDRTSFKTRSGTKNGITATGYECAGPNSRRAYLPGSRYSGCGTGRCARLPADSGRHAV